MRDSPQRPCAKRFASKVELQMGMIYRLAIWVLLMIVPPASAVAGSFDVDLSNAWAHCRDALYQSSPGQADGPATAEALDAFLAAWDRLTNRWTAHPPAPYDRDAEFGAMLGAIGDIAEQARHEIRHGRMLQTHATLSQVRALLAEGRRRNGLEAYADPLDAFDEKLAETAEDELDAPDISADQFVLLVEQAGVLAYLVERMEKRAPARFLDDPAFLEQVESLAARVRALRVAVLSGRRDPVAACLADLRREFDRFYLLYG